MVRRKQQRKRPMSEINVVPYIDVMLVLLVIFMVTTPLLAQGVNVNLPEAKAKILNSKEQEPIIVSVDVNGKYFLNIDKNPSQAVDEDTIVKEVSGAIKDAKETGKERTVLVKGDEDVDYGKVLKAMVFLQAAGADKVGLLTQDQKTKK